MTTIHASPSIKAAQRLRTLPRTDTARLTWQYAVFATELGYMALAGDDQLPQWLSIGHRSAAAARTALREAIAAHAPHVELHEDVDWNEEFQQRLMAYADGDPDNFLDVTIPLLRQPFAAQVALRCRQIPYGQTLSYGELAFKAGSARAARAVGNTMAGNRLPIIVPCHRVLAASGALGGYSGAGGLSLKQQLLDLEAKNAFRVKHSKSSRVNR